MSHLTFTTNNDIITNEFIDRIYAACENESRLIDIDLLNQNTGGPPPRPVPVTYSFNVNRIAQARAHFQETGQNIMLMKIVNSPLTLIETRVYYVNHNDRYFTVVTQDGLITQCVGTLF